MSAWAHFHRFESLLRAQGLSSPDAVRAWPGTPIKLQRGRRDVCRIVVQQNNRQHVLFLKRNHKSYRKHVLASLLRHWRVVSAAESEANSLMELQKLGVPVSPCVAVGAETGWASERFSFIITESAAGQPLDEFLAANPSDRAVERTGRAVMQLVRQIHDAGVGIPTLMGRHIFVEHAETDPQLCLIDVDRLVRRRNRWRLRVRDLAQLHLSIPLQHLSLRRRVRILRMYASGDRSMIRRLLRAIAQRTDYLLVRRRRRAEAFLLGLAPSTSQRVMAGARASMDRWQAIARGANALGGGAGVALLWVAYALGSRDLFPLDEAEEWSRLADHLDDATPVLPSVGWLLSSPAMLGVALILASLLAARWLSLQRRS